MVAAFWFLVDNMVVILAVIVDFSGLVGFVAADFLSKKSIILVKFLVFLLISGCLFGLGGGVGGFRGRGVSSNFDFFFNFLFLLDDFARPKCFIRVKLPPSFTNSWRLVLGWGFLVFPGIFFVLGCPGGAGGPILLDILALEFLGFGVSG